MRTMQKRILSITITIILILTSWMSAIAVAIQEKDTGNTDTLQSAATLPIGTPVADAGGPYTGITHIAVNFDGSNSYNPDGTITSYTWYCGDGTVENGITTNHIYTSPGTYTLTLVLKDNEGNCGTDYTTVTIVSDGPPTIEMTNPLEHYLYFRDNQMFSLSSSTIVIGPCEIQVNANDDVSIRRVEFYIDNVLKHVDYDEPYTMDWNTGHLSHTIKAIAYDTSGNQNAVENTVFKWRLHPLLILGAFSLLGKGASATGGSWLPDKETNQHILLSILRFYLNALSDSNDQNENSPIIDLIQQILNNDQKTIDIIEFLNTHPLIKNRLEDQYPLLYNILMFSDDGTESDGAKLFEKNRLIQIIMFYNILQWIQQSKQKKLFDGSSLSDSVQWVRNHPALTLISTLLTLRLLSILFNTGPDDTTPDITTENKAPHANAGGPYEEQLENPVFFSAEKSYDEDGTIVTFKWDFGDGSQGTGKTISHQYNSTGTYVVTLIVTDDDGETSTDTAIITIKPIDESTTTDEEDTDPLFWVISGSLSALLLLGVAVLILRRRLFE